MTLEYAVALSIGFSIGFRFTIPFQSYFITALVLGAVLVCGMCGFRIATQSKSPPSDLLDMAALIVLVCLQMAVLGWLKVMLPHATPFWADPLLADLDAALFLGTDPWRVSHDLFWWATPVIDRAYVSWHSLKYATLVGLALATPSPLRSRAILSYFLIVSSAAIGQYALPSVGPIFYEQFGYGDRFGDLPLQPWAQTASGYLLATFSRAGGAIGGGISAMPSLHVAIALWLALVWASYFPRVRWLGFGYFGLILVGSVHLGWHYAVDGLVASGIALATWRVADFRGATRRCEGRRRERACKLSA